MTAWQKPRRIPSRPTKALRALLDAANRPADPLAEVAAPLDFLGADGVAMPERPARVRRKSPEADFQKMVAVHLGRVILPHVPWSAFPAGGGGRLRGAQLQAMGLKRGWPDIVILLPPRGRFLGLELKAIKGRLGPEQVLMQMAIRAVGGAYESARTIEQVAHWLAVWGVPTRPHRLG